MLKSVTADVLAVTRNALYAFYIYSGAVNFLHLIVESAVRRDNVGRAVDRSDMRRADALGGLQG